MNNLTAGTNGGLFVSKDQGKAWKALGEELINNNVRDIDVVGNEIYVATEEDGVFYSTDYGDTWVSYNLGLESLHINTIFAQEDNVLVGTYDAGIYKLKKQSDKLTVKRNGDYFVMNFPTRMPVPAEKNPLLEEALGCKVLETYASRDIFVVVESEEVVKNLKPDIALLSKVSKGAAFGIIVTARGENCDFVSRFFPPNAGVIEDPVTGSSHTNLIPYWSKRLNKTKMVARQLSSRGGILICEDLGERVNIGGKAMCYLKGEIEI